MNLTQIVRLGSWIAAIGCAFAVGSLVAQERTTPPKQKPLAPHATPTTTLPEEDAPKDEEGRLILEGVVTTMWTCPLPDAKGEHADTMTYLLFGKSDSPIELSIPDAILESYGGYTSLWGKRVSVHGRFRGGAGATQVFEVATLGVRPERLSNEVESGKPAPIVNAFSGPARPFLNILTRFSDTVSASDLPKSAYNSLFANTYPGLDHYWRDQSYGQMTLEGSTLMGWITLPNPRAFYTTNGQVGGPLDYGKTVTATMDAVDASVNFRKYYGVNVLINTTLGDAGGRGGGWRMTRDGETRLWGVTLDGSSAGVRHGHPLMAHEIGHSLGLPHSQGSDRQPYSSPWDIMSSSYFWDTTLSPTQGWIGAGAIAYHRNIRNFATVRYDLNGAYQPNWIPQERNYTLYNRGSATIRLDALGAIPTANYQMATVHIRGDMTRFYTIEARLKTGYDQFSRTGVIIHRVHRFRASNEGDPAQVVTNPDGAPAGAPAGLWEAGETYKDTENGITIKVNDVTATSCGITITASKEANPVNVVNTADSGSGSLRNALLYANRVSGTRIRFKIPTTDPGNVGGVFRIALLSPLPEVRGEGTNVDGVTQAEFAGNTNLQGPEVLLDGTNAGDWARGLYVTASNVSVRSLAIGGFKGEGIGIDGLYGASGNRIEQCYVGTDATGTVPLPNGWTGIAVFQGATNTTIGGATATSRCVVSGNSGGGIVISDKATQPTRIQQNYIGTNAKGDAALPNGREGVIAQNSASSITTLNNVISGNTYSGFLALGSANLVFQGNKIGLDATGTKAIGNGRHGIEPANKCTNATIGGTTEAQRNLISGNGGSGINLSGSESSGIAIQGNFIGTDITGKKGLGNRLNGVRSGVGLTAVTIGGKVVGAGNLLSGNGSDALLFDNTLSGTVQGNYLGVDITGLKALPNGGSGVGVWNGSANIVIGGSSASTRNIVSGNRSSGIAIGNAANITIAGNYIGTDKSGVLRIPNESNGIALWSGTTNCQLGGGTVALRNIISGNLGTGISFAGQGTANSRIQGNYIGLDVTGLKAMGNGGDGIAAWDKPNAMVIGGTTAGLGNVIANNSGTGISLWQTTNSTIQGNIVGSDITGKVVMGNGGNGIALWDGCQNNHIGGTTAGARNLVVNSQYTGVVLNGPTNANNQVQGNIVGMDISGKFPLPNADGFWISNKTSGNLIGGDVAGAGNLLSGNRGGGIGMGDCKNITVQGNIIGADITGKVAMGNQFGIGLWDGTTGAKVGGTTSLARNIIVANKDSGIALVGETNHDNIIQGNSIGLDITGLAVLANVNFGIEIRLGSHNNQIGGTGVGMGNTIRGSSEGVRLFLGTQIQNISILQNSISGCSSKGIALYEGANKDVKPPTLNSAAANATQTTILGSLKGVANKTYRIEFFANAPTAKPQGETYLGFRNVTTNAAGSASFTFTAASLAADTQITATATDPTGNTSEFSAARKVIK